MSAGLRSPAASFPRRLASRIALLYALCGGLWILLSDRIVAWFTDSPQRITTLQTYKGWFFIGVTATLVYLICLRYLLRLQTAHRRLQRNQQRLSLILSGLEIFFWERELAGDTIRVIDFKDLGDTTSARVSSMVGCPASEIIHPDDRPASEAAWQHFLGGQSPRYECEHRIRAADGDWRWVLCRAVILERDAQNRPTKVSGVYFDITERKRSEAEHRRLAAAVAHVADCIVIADRDMCIEYVNPAFERMLGYANGEVIGKTPFDVFFDNEHEPGIARSVQETVQQGRTWIGRRHNRCKDGRLVPVDGTVSPIFDPEGALIGFVGVHRDVTERQALESQLRQAQKMEAVGQLAGGIAHDFNNLLQVIHGQTEMALEDLPPASPARAGLEQVIEAANRATTLVRQLLAFSRSSAIEPRALDLNRVIADLTKSLLRLIGEHIELQVLPGDGLPPIHADPVQVEQVLINLCVNARDAIGESGRITIQTRTVHCDRDFCRLHSWSHEDELCVQLSIADTGHGIPEEIRDRIFDPFFTTKEVGKGTGLGLATVYGIVKQHEGLILLESVPGQGTTFHVYWPVARGGGDAAAGEPTTAGTSRGNAECILVAEDDDLVRRLAVQVLSGAGYTVVAAEDGEQARRLFDECPDRIDLALVDIVMPKLGGQAVSQYFRRLRPDLPVIFSSGYIPVAETRYAVDGDTRPILQKPYTPAELLRAVKNALEHRVPS
jgi:PAS domain S-box-containing protein